jgi:REP element-mobilizing transposase RayT
MARGNQGREVFRDNQDRKTFLTSLGEACAKTVWQVHAYVLMGNHYHLLLQSPEPNLVEGMKWLQGTYTQRFNNRHKLRGHLLDVGGQSFLEKLEGYLGPVLEGRRRESFSAGAKARHDAVAAEQVLARGMKALGGGNK